VSTFCSTKRIVRLNRRSASVQRMVNVALVQIRVGVGSKMLSVGGRLSDVSGPPTPPAAGTAT